MAQPRIGWARAALLTALLLLLAPASHAGELRVYFIDIGQGDAQLVVSPTGTTVLIDAGPPGAQRAILPVLRREGIEALDVALISHAHNDHIGGFVRVLQQVPARRLLDPGFEHPSGTYVGLLQYAEREGVPYELVRSGLVEDLGGGATLEVMAPRSPLLAGTRSDCNSNSVIARVRIGGVSILLTGDAEAPAEARLLDDHEDVDVTVLKVAHHGSEHSTSLRFLDRTTPDAAVISAGHGNSYGHPHAALTGRLVDRAVPSYVTFMHGTVTLETDGVWWKLHSEQWLPEWGDGQAAEGLAPRPEREAHVAPLDHQPGAVYASENSRLYHQPWCKGGLKRISSVFLRRFASAEDAEASGRSAATDCGSRPASWIE